MGKLWTYHNAESLATHRGPAHVAKHTALKARAALALSLFINLTPD